MNFETLLLEINDRVAVITINRPKALNAINKKLMAELRDAVESLRNHDVIGVIITGSGEKAFAAGADIKEFSDLNAAEGSALSRFGHETYALIEQFSKPIIAAVNGFALGGGCELAMACHLRVASDNARFGQPEVNLGLIPGYGGSQRLVQLVGKGRALELLLTADMIKADIALHYGLVNKVVPQAELLEHCRELILKLGTKGPLAIANTITAVNAYFDKSQNGFEFEIEAFGRAIASEDCKEGALAFVEKRPANFKGR